MYARIVTFRLDGPTDADYRSAAAELAPAFNEWTGLRSKLWIADEATGTYGGIYVFDSKADADASRATPPFQALVTHPSFADLSIVEHELDDRLSAITGGRSLV